MPYLVLGIALLAGLLLLMRWATSADPRVLAWVLRVLVGLILLGFLGLVALAGRWTWLAYALPFALPFFFHWRSNRIRAKNAGGPSPGQSSDVATKYLRMSLDHDSGEMSGVILRGAFAGRDLESLNLRELIDLLHECADDADSVRVLEAYLDRVHGPQWRGDGGADTEDAAAGRSDAWGGAMTFEEAWDILGLEPGADEDAIKEAHRRLMAKLHPDRGGSTYLAAKLNQAKDLLLGA
ncbi:MAG: DnaJ domain-containing protein [Alphaproteobacteria bacterium]|nr:DnaJ domain-containing protein [Alphaproteobacteria bacterium]